MKSSLTASELRSILNYDPSTGVFTWARKIARCIKLGGVAGCMDWYGYTIIRINKNKYGAHRLAWLYVHGVWPRYQIDHVNGIRDDNRICNLREATVAENGQNRKIQRNNTSGHPGVVWHRGARKWQAQITINGKQLYLGRYDLLEDAVLARREAKEVHHTFHSEDKQATSARYWEPREEEE